MGTHETVERCIVCARSRQSKCGSLIAAFVFFIGQTFDCYTVIDIAFVPVASGGPRGFTEGTRGRCCRRASRFGTIDVEIVPKKSEALHKTDSHPIAGRMQRLTCARPPDWELFSRTPQQTMNASRNESSNIPKNYDWIGRKWNQR